MNPPLLHQRFWHKQLNMHSVLYNGLTQLLHHRYKCILFLSLQLNNLMTSKGRKICFLPSKHVVLFLFRSLCMLLPVHLSPTFTAFSQSSLCTFPHPPLRMYFQQLGSLLHRSSLPILWNSKPTTQTQIRVHGKKKVPFAIKKHQNISTTSELILMPLI